MFPFYAYSSCRVKYTTSIFTPFVMDITSGSGCGNVRGRFFFLSILTRRLVCLVQLSASSSARLYGVPWVYLRVYIRTIDGHQNYLLDFMPPRCHHIVSDLSVPRKAYPVECIPVTLVRMI
jgi:hypothetical protein